MKCKVCNCENQDNAQYCIQCGTVLNPVLENGLDAYSDPKSHCNPLAIVGLIASITAIVLFWVPYQWIVSVAGLVICIIARIQLRKDGRKGKELTLAGILIAILSGTFNFLIFNRINHFFQFLMELD